jgi:broad specificity phosphatase PhoE
MPIMTAISTLRHAETDYTRQQRYCGTIDAPLNNAGIQDTREARKRLKTFSFDAAITSHLRRTSETARILLGEGVPIVRSPLCNERNFGALQGKMIREVENVKPRVKFIRMGGDYHSLNMPGGESFLEVRRRAMEFLRFVLAGYSGRTVLIVSHNVFLQQFHGCIRKLSWDEALKDNPKPLDMMTFLLEGGRLVKETELNLVERKQVVW